MGKSLGNTYTLDNLQEKGIEPLAYKLFCFSSNYTKKLNFTWEGAKAAQTSLERLRDGLQKHKNGTEIIKKEVLSNYEEKFLQEINDNLNVTSAMSVVWDIIRNEKKSKDFYQLICKFDEVLGLNLANASKEKLELDLPKEVEKLVKQRKLAREQKNWAESDRLRDEIQKLGYCIKDSKTGMELQKM